MLSSCYEKVVLKLFEDLDTPFTQALLQKARKGEWEAILREEVAPGCYDDPERFFRDRQALAMVQKLEDLTVTGVDPSAAAEAKMFEAERLCKLTNDRFEAYMAGGPYRSTAEARLAGKLLQVRKIFRRLLGPVPDWHQIHPRFGPGAVLETVKGRVSPIDKISVRPTSYPSCVYLEADWNMSAWCRSLGYRSQPEYVRGERFSTVPKKWNIKRTIGVGASLPVYYQLGVGSHMRRRLKTFGIDLEEGQATHRQVAASASRDGRYATVDSSSASDTVARMLVKFLSTSEWYTLLDTLRAPMLLVGDRWFRLERFSSMGNGYTFELETAIFLSLAVFACEEAGIEAQPGNGIWVYGDDIIVPTEAYPQLVALLSFCGFIPNKEKSFATGPFRESCGGDYWGGEVVRPHFQKVQPEAPNEWIQLANGLRRTAFARYGDLGPFKRAWLASLDRLPTAVRRCRGPAVLGDLVITDHPENWSYVVRRGSRYFRVWRPVQERLNLRRYHWTAVLAYSTTGHPSDAALRDRVTGYRFGRVLLNVTCDSPAPRWEAPHGVVPVGWWGHWRSLERAKFVVRRKRR